jgi:hypothetical protein
VNEQRIRELLAKGELRKRSSDVARAKSLMQAALDSAAFAKSVPLSEQTSTGVFKELYDAFRQLGDAKWWTLGYEPWSHKASIELLKEADITAKQSIQQLPRIMELRNDATYRGYRIPRYEAQEILVLWDKTHQELLAWIGK